MRAILPDDFKRALPAVAGGRPRPRWADLSPDRSLALRLLQEGFVAPDAVLRSLELQKRHGGRLEDILLAQGLLAPATLYAAMAAHHGVRQIDPADDPPDPELVDRLGAARCLRDGLLPWRRIGAATVVATAHPQDFAAQQPGLTEALGPVVMAVSQPARIERAVLSLRGEAMAQAAEARVPERESCRDVARAAVPLRLGLGLSALILALWVVPATAVTVLTLWAVATLVAVTGLKVAAIWAARRPLPPEPPAPVIARLPVVSVMVPLYREATIAGRLVRRLEKLDYPHDRLDIVLVVEAEDAVTQRALTAAGLPTWMRMVVVPPGRVKTKPRALNLALDLCRGSLIGVYDAEDAPAPDQIRRVVERFHSRGPQVACLQGVLDFYNPHRNWMARCFTMEYATWFRVVLPGIARLGLPVPLGGTTLFFRREVLEQVGAWDAHNVTEDADLGIRLARHGYRTELLDTVTEEEANCRPLAWVKQRSRWIKGYIMTWAVHMRDPARLWRDLGPRGFLGFQVLFLATLSQFLLAPLLWAFWLVPLGLPHPAATLLPGWALAGTAALFLATEAVNLGAGLLGLRRRGGGLSPLWLLTLPLYYPLAVAASYKALWEMLWRPFYWDKTSHGTQVH